MPAPITDAERAALPERLRWVDKYQYSADCFDNREAVLDAMDDQYDWLLANYYVEDADANL